MKRLLLCVALVPILGFSQAPTNYYEGTNGLTGYALKSKLYEIVSKKSISWNYSDLQQFYNQTDLDKYYDHGNENQSILLDIYSEIPSGADNYEYTADQMIGSASAEGMGWNREHMMPQSTFYSNYPMYSDLFFVVPTDARINQLRSNYPYGIAGATNYHTFSNGSKINRNGTPGSGYTGRVYEPIDEFKGDVARSLLYFAVRYESKLSSFNHSPGTSAANDTNPLNGTAEKAFEDWYITMLKNWHVQDPVSQREIDRNNAVFAIQKNRNPFIDRPEWVNAIWNQASDVTPPSAPSSFIADQTSAYFVKLKWNAASDNDILGYKVFQNGELVATSRTSEVIIDRLSPGMNYNFTVRAYDNGYLESVDSEVLTVVTANSDVYASDLMITKYVEGTGNNNAIEITNKTGHSVDLNKYRLSIQFYNGSSGNYYFPAPYELEGSIADNESIVILNPYSNLSCITNDDADFVSAAPQLSYTGTQYMELRYASSTVDAIGLRDSNNAATLADRSLYRLPSVGAPNSAFNISEWQEFPVDYCADLGTLNVSTVNTNREKYVIYPNPVVSEIRIAGKNLKEIKEARILDITGKSLQVKSEPFKNAESLNVQNLPSGVYLLKLDNEILKFIKN